MKKKIYFIRHGKTQANLKHLYCGWTDVPLLDSEERRLSDLKIPKIDKVYTSPLIRCQQTAKIFFPNHDIKVIEGLKEINFGDFEGKDYKELSADSRYQAWIDSMGRLPFPNGESIDSFNQRVKKTMLCILDLEKTFSNQNICIVSHEGVYRSIIFWLSKGAISFYDSHLKNGELVEITSYLQNIED